MTTHPRQTEARTAPPAATWVHQPVWWAALTVLVVNDHVLKGAGLLPGWLTGKLSDFAGLVVAPVVAVSVLRARSTAIRATLFLCVAFSFVALKVSPAAAEWLERILRTIGLPSRIWVDPTDLVALAALLLSWRLVQAEPRTGPKRRELVERVAIVLAGAACMATTSGPSGYASLYVLNATRQPVVVAIHRADAAACEALDSTAEEPLDASDFTFERCVEVGPFEAFALDPPDAGPGPDTDRSCDSVAITSERLSPVGVWWGDTTVVPIRSPYPDQDDRALHLQEVGNNLIIERAPVAIVWRLTEPPSLDTCAME